MGEPLQIDDYDQLIKRKCEDCFSLMDALVLMAGKLADIERGVKELTAILLRKEGGDHPP